jgi:ABC-type nitrate/sulfonate/bicarbonate transport system substrate-binding protein
MRSSRRGAAVKVVALTFCGLLTLIGFSTSYSVAAETSGSSSSANSQPCTGTIPTVTFGNPVANIDTSGIQIAQQMGYFKDACLDVKITTLAGSAVALAALQSGGIQFTEAQPLSLYAGLQKGLDLLAVAGMDHGYTLYLELAKNAVPDLRPYPTSSLAQVMNAVRMLKIGIVGSGTTTAAALLSIFAQEANVPKLTPISFQSLSAEAAALEHGQIDGMFSAPPASQQAVYTLGARIVLSPKKLQGSLSILGTAQYTVLTTTNKYAQANPDVVKRVAKVIARINDWFIANPSEAAAAVAKLEFPDVDPQVIADAMSAYTWDGGGTMSDDGWKATMTLANKYPDALGFIGNPVTAAIVKEAYTNQYLQ